VAVVLVAVGVAAGAAGGSFVDDFRTPGTESQSAVDVLDQRFPAASGRIALIADVLAPGGAPEPSNVIGPEGEGN
jgi:RND superfamily putative drug exporter